MKKPIPAIHETPEALPQLLHTESEAQRHQRVQALSVLPTRQARSRKQVARLLGGSRNTVGRWLAAYETGGVRQLLTIAKAPGKGPLLTLAMQQALRERLAQPQGFASSKALWPWLPHAYGGPMADKTGQRFVRYPLRAKLKVPRKSHRKKR
jgi:transposase